MTWQEIWNSYINIEPGLGVICLRLLCAMLVGTAVGMEREFTHRPAGLRTHILVALGACVASMMGEMLFSHYAALGATPDPARLSAQVITGVGFLGAGTIMKEGANVKGLTTAAGLWASAGVGLALGIGFYEGAITAGVSIYLILTLLQKLENRVNKKIKVLELYVELRTSVSIADFLQSLRELELKLENIQFEPEGGMEVDTRAVILTLRAKRPTDHKPLRDKIRKIDGVVHLEEL